VDNERHRIVLSSWTTVDWHSLTFAGERHRARFSVTGVDAAELATQWTGGIEDADLPLGGGRFVADLTVTANDLQPDGSVRIDLEALTLDD
jgi:hypothetical protein